MKRVEVTYSTIGQSGPGPVALGGGYRYRGDQAWPADRSRYEDGGDLARKTAANAGGAVGAETRRKRLLEFAAALADLGEPDPAEAPNAVVIEAGKRVGVTAKTAKGYRTAIKQQRQHEQAGPDEDAGPREIVADLHAEIARFSPGHASLVAEYEQLQRRPGYQADQETA